MKDSVQLTWPADGVRYYNYGIQQGTISPIVQGGMVLAQVIRPVSAHVFVGVLDAVRNKVLDLALELEQAAPAAGQPDAPADTNSHAAQIINNYSFQGSSNVAIHSSDVTQTVQLPRPGDAKALLRYLGAAGVPPEGLIRLQEALQADQTDREGGGHTGRWERTRAWLSVAATDVGTGATGGAIGSAAAAFLGG